MNAWLQLILIAAFWGGSHVLVRISTPVFGPESVAWARIFIGAVVMFFYVVITKQKLNIKKNYLHFAVVGALNASIPFFLFARASVELPASYLVVLNSTMPIFSAILAVFILNETFTFKKLLGLALGITGVYFVEEYGVVSFHSASTALALGEGLGAALCYALAGMYIKKRVAGISSEVLTSGSFAFASLFLLPFFIQSNLTRHEPILWEAPATLTAAACVLFLGLVCTAFAFLLLYRLIAKLGPFRASLCNFMIPVFGIIWGVIFLHEQVYLGMLGGAAIIIAAMALFMKK